MSLDSTVYRSLDEVMVVRQQSRQLLHESGSSLHIEMESLRDMPQLGGTADPLRYLQSLPAVSTNNEMSSGIHIQGTDDYQSAISINGAAVYYPNHLMGLYSTFIADHFSSITMTQAAHDASAPNRLGGNICFNTYSRRPARWHISGNAGIIHSDATYSTPVGKRSALWLSARASYVNLLYKKLLRFDGFQALYGFQDANISFMTQPTARDRVVVTAFFSHDKMGLETDFAEVSIPWYNLAGSVRYTHTADWGEWETTVCSSGYRNNIGVDVRFEFADSPLESSVKTRNDMGSINTTNRLQYNISEDISIRTGIDYCLYSNQPIELTAVNLSQNFTIPAVSREKSDELSVHIGMSHSVREWFEYDLGVRGTMYYNKGSYWALDPRLTMIFKPTESQRISVHYGMYHQYFHKTGLIEGGMPTDFFLLADREFKPEMAHSTELSYSIGFLNDKYSVSTSAYFKQMHNVIESTGNLFSLILNGFQYKQDIVVGDGRNYGATLLLKKNKGQVTGYVSYSLGWAKRRFEQLEGRHDYCYSADHERRHDLSVLLQSRIGKRWSIGALFTLASGLPYTQPEEVYIVNKKVICRYGIHNGARMPLYNRLDLSANCWIIKEKDRELGINLSLYNAYNYRNAQYVVYRENLGIIYGSSISRIIPSVSLFFRF